MKSTRIILAGGFLGAGKTTLLWQAAQNLMKKGIRVGLITNDQAPELVDSTLLALNDLKVAEVSGSCFCCNFNGFTKAIEKLGNEIAADVIIAEPVGSCTDLSATIMQPLKKFWGNQISLSPLSVLVDPFRLNSILNGENGGLHKDAAYILHKQLEESDVILLNKVDKLNKEELEILKDRAKQKYPQAKILAISALLGDGIDEWLYSMMTTNDSGRQIVPIDYDIYTNGEAVLGWLNGTIRLTGEMRECDRFVNNLLTRLATEFDTRSWAVGHVKAIAESEEALLDRKMDSTQATSNFVVGNLTGTGETLSIRGSIGQSNCIKLTINARVETSPESLEQVVRDTLHTLTIGEYHVEELAWRSLQPGRPEPTHRFTEVVKE